MSNLAASRVILKRVREGVSIGMTGDGPLGPALAVKDAPLDWARVMKRPVYGYAFATKRHRILASWDNMMLPLPFTRGAVVFARIAIDLPRQPTPEQLEATRGQLKMALDAMNAKADTLAA